MSLGTGIRASAQTVAIEPKASRILFIDIAKGLAICSVLLCHLPQKPLVMNWLVVWNMPLFIAVSGVFDKGLPWRDSLKKTVPLIYAYLSYGFASCLLALAFEHKFPLGQLFLADPQSVWALPFFGHFWFIAALVMVKLLTMLPHGRSFWLWGMLAVAGWLWGRNSTEAQSFPLMLVPALLLGIYYVSGPALLLLTQKGRRFKAAVCGVFLAAFLVTLMVYPMSRLRMYNYHLCTVADPVSAMVLGFTGVLCLFFLAQYLQEKSGILGTPLAYIGRHSFSFFALHLGAFFLARVAISKIGIHVGWIQNLGCFGFALVVGYLHSLVRRRLDAKLTPLARSMIFASSK